MNTRPERTLLKEGSNRRVFMERTPGREQVVKCFRAQRWLQRWRDRWRARHEFDLMTRLNGLGLRVPSPLGLRRTQDGTWELSQELVPGATTLEELIRGAPTPSVSPECLAQRLGRLVARAHDVGLEHADLHTANFLCDNAGWPWLIDFTRARIRSRLDENKLETDLIELAAATRECVPIALRRRFLVAWRRAITRPEARALPPLRELGQGIEARARVRRRAWSLEQLPRWTKTSGLCRRLSTGGGWVVRRVSSQQEHELVAWARTATPSPTPRARPSASQSSFILVLGDRSVRRDWSELGRALYHELPAVRPVLLIEGHPCRAVFECPRSALPARGPGSVQPSPQALAALHELLADRGFSTLGPEHCYVSAEGRLLLGPGIRLRG